MVRRDILFLWGIILDSRLRDGESASGQQKAE